MNLDDPCCSVIIIMNWNLCYCEAIGWFYMGLSVVCLYMSLYYVSLSPRLVHLYVNAGTNCRCGCRIAIWLRIHTHTPADSIFAPDYIEHVCLATLANHPILFSLSHGRIGLCATHSIYWMPVLYALCSLATTPFIHAPQATVSLSCWASSPLNHSRPFNAPYYLVKEH